MKRNSQRGEKQRIKTVYIALNATIMVRERVPQGAQ